MAEKIKVLLVEPLEEPRVVEIEHTLDGMRDAVGGWISAIFPFDDPVAIVCDDEAKLKGCMPNRVLVDGAGDPYDVICGPFFLCGVGGEDFASISDGLAEKYMEVFRWPELLVRGLDGHVYWRRLGSGQPSRCIL